MHGIFAASTGFSVQFFPESVILGCGPDAARAYPYTVVADGAASYIRVDAPDHPLHLAFRPDGSLDPGAGSYQVHGRITTGEDDNDNFTFAPNEQTCALAALAPSQQIPASGGTAATMVASGGAPGAAPSNGGGTLSTPAAPLGNATLTIVPGLPAQAGAPNPLASRPCILLRHSYGQALAIGGVTSTRNLTLQIRRHRVRYPCSRLRKDLGPPFMPTPSPPCAPMATAEEPFPAFPREPTT